VDALADVSPPGEWVSDGACRSVLNATAIFFPTRGQSQDIARAICDTCPVLGQCRAYALAHPEVLGVWGGLSHLERQRRNGSRSTSDLPGRSTSGRGRRNGVATIQRRLGRLLDSPGHRSLIRCYTNPASAYNAATQLRTGRRPTPPGRWLFETARQDDGTAELYATYLGPEPEQATG